MKDILAEHRTIMIGRRAETFINYTRLKDRASGLIDALEKIAAAIPHGSIGTATDMKKIGELSADLGDVIAAQSQWLIDDNAAILTEIEALRCDIRNLNGFDPMPDEEG